MKKLDKSKAYYLGDLNSEQRAYLYEVLLSDDESFSFILKSEFKIEASDYVFYDENEWDWYDEKDFKRLFNLEVINALTLFDEEVWKPKQGDKVFVSNDKQKWHERVFVVEHNNFYQCEPLHENISNTLTPWQHIKPYEDEIKVGDWVKRISDETIWKIRDKEDVNVALNSECTKITNPQLIELLNKEL